MALEEALVTVWWGALVEGAEEVELEGRGLRCGRPARNGCAKLIFCVPRGRSCAAGVRIRKRNRLGATGESGAQGDAFLSAGRYNRQCSRRQSHDLRRKKRGGTTMGALTAG